MGTEPQVQERPPSRFARWLVRNKEAISGLQSLAGILGWVVGGLWVLYLLDPISARQPELALTQQVSSVRVAPNHHAEGRRHDDGRSPRRLQG